MPVKLLIGRYLPSVVGVEFIYSKFTTNQEDDTNVTSEQANTGQACPIIDKLIECSRDSIKIDRGRATAGICILHSGLFVSEELFYAVASFLTGLASDLNGVVVSFVFIVSFAFFLLENCK